jgi:hypothetical protein
VLTGITKNTSIIRLQSGEVVAKITYEKAQHIVKNKGKASAPSTAEQLDGFQLRYIYFLDPTARERLTVPVLPFSEIDRRGAGMYKGKQRVQSRAGSDTMDTPANLAGKGGSTPTPALHSP